MELTIEQSCPGCGAEIELHEDDRMIRCPFCEVNNYMLAQGGRRFVLPWLLPSHVTEKDLCFVPYLRFKGAIFYTSAGKVDHKLVDTTRLGLENTSLPVSLRLRPQAMKVRPVIVDIQGRFLGQTVKTKTIFADAVRITTLFSKRKDDITYHRAFIGESISRIYLPCYIHQEKLFDAVDDKVLGTAAILEKHQSNSFPGKDSWEPRFISTICPACADVLEGERDSLVLHCQNCRTFWQEQEGKFIPVKWRMIPTENANARYLPFWKITFQTTGEVLKSFGEFLRFTNQPVVVRREHDNKQLTFWIPAFKINPKAFLQTAAQLTITQLFIPEGKKDVFGNIYPVTLHWREAFEAIKSVLAATTVNKRTIYPLLPKIKVISAGYSLRYLPFTALAHDLIQEHTSVTIMSAALKYGRKL